MAYTSYSEMYKLEEISFTAGTTIFLDFEVFSPEGVEFDISDVVFTWKLSPYGSKESVILTKSAYEVIANNKVRVTLLSTDTASLSGKYIQELTTVGDELVGEVLTEVTEVQQGIVIIGKKLG